MANNDTNPGEEPEPTPAVAIPTMTDFMSSVMERFLQQEEAQRATNAQLAQLAAVLAPLTASTSNPPTVRRQLFGTDNAPLAEEQTTNPSEQVDVQGVVRLTAAPNPSGADLETIREIAALKQSLLDINSKIHRVTSSAPQIDKVLAATLRTPFSARISGVRLRTIEKVRLPFFRGDTDPAEHVRAFYIALARANLSEGGRTPARASYSWKL